MVFNFTGFFVNLVSYATLVVTIHILFTALIYMVARFMSNDNLLGFSKHELAQAVYSLIIVGSVLVGISAINNLFCTTLVEKGMYQDACTQNIGFDAHLKVARAHLAEMYNNIRVLAKGTLRAFDWAATAAGASISAGLLQMRPMAWSGFHAFVFGESFSILYKVLLFVKLQELFLVMNAAYFFPVFFNLGLVFRILPFTRKLGGLLMGITLGLYFVLPYMYILSQVIITSAEHFSTRFVLDTAKFQFLFLTFGNIMETGPLAARDFDDILEDMRKSSNNPDTNVFGQAATKVLSDSLSQKSGSQNPTYDMNIGTAAALPSPKDSAAFGRGLEYYDPHNPSNHSYTLVEVIARIIIAVTFTSVFSIVGTISAIREISALFGGDVEIAGLTKLI